VLLAVLGGPAYIARNVSLLNLPVSEEGDLLLILGQLASTADPLKDHLADESLLRQHPWRTGWRSMETAAATAGAQTLQQLQTGMVEMAKLHLLGLDDAVLLHLLLYFDDAERRLFAGCLMAYAGAQRLQLFNYIVASREPPAGSTLSGSDAFITLRGATILAMREPMWPRDERFASSTLQLFANAGNVSGGGGVGGSGVLAPSRWLDGMTRGEAFGERLTSRLHGAGTIPVRGEADISSIERKLIPWMARMEQIVQKHNLGLPPRAASAAPTTTSTSGTPPRPSGTRADRASKWRDRNLQGGEIVDDTAPSSPGNGTAPTRL
jgi:hypothetical protein